MAGESGVDYSKFSLIGRYYDVKFRRIVQELMDVALNAAKAKYEEMRKKEKH